MLRKSLNRNYVGQQRVIEADSRQQEGHEGVTEAETDEITLENIKTTFCAVPWLIYN